MLDTKLTPADDVAPEKLKEPSKRWRNRYRCIKDGISLLTRVPRKAGDLFWGAVVFPSKEIAEQRSKDEEDVLLARDGVLFDEWLGAFAVSE